MQAPALPDFALQSLAIALQVLLQRARRHELGDVDDARLLHPEGVHPGDVRVLCGNWVSVATCMREGVSEKERDRDRGRETDR